MAEVVGAGFWSSLWEGMKTAGMIVLIFGVVWLVNDFCASGNVECSFGMDQ